MHYRIFLDRQEAADMIMENPIVAMENRAVVVMATAIHIVATRLRGCGRSES